ncbi:MAG: 50S ribosomal protein L6 [Bdellovibrionaceae bacterium]|nr:50S ribosomal protein L6 [Pseudobdellovibrionaceae bacterium]|tara:strand:- start:574 stop:1116 length:543 start_codon:yes stop_codon:yes gene_type:complete
MSRVGKLPVKVTSGVKVNLTPTEIKFEGPKGKLQFPLPQEVTVTLENEELTVKPRDGFKKARAMYGTTRAILNNMMVGCSSGFTKELDIIGVGYRAAVKGRTLELNLGFSHPIEHELPAGIEAKVEKNTHLVLTGADKVLLGMVAAKIRSYRPPEPYQGKGVKYSDERIIRKQGKAAGAK